MSTRRLSQNQFIGLKADMPLTYIEGATYLAIDTEQLYMYNDEEQPILIGGDGISGGSSAQERAFASASAVDPLQNDSPSEEEIKEWNDNLPEPYVDTIIYYTGSETSTDPTTSAFHVDINGDVTDLSGDDQVITYPDIFGGNALIRGGVIHIENLDFYVWSTGYIIDDVYYDTPVSGIVTLDPSDPTHDRIDVFVINNDGAGTSSVGFVTGVAEASPFKPAIDLSNQVEVSFRIVQATETEPSEISKEIIYNEDLGEPNEWDIDEQQLSDNPSEATDPYNGTVSYYQPSPGVFAYKKATTMTSASDSKLVFAIKLEPTGTLFQRQSIEIWIYEDGANDNEIATINITNIGSNRYNLDFFLLNEWQLVSIPLSDFEGLTTNFDKIRIITNQTPSLKIDWLHIENGGGSGGSGGIDISSGLESITEGGNNGWRLIGKDPANYGDIGNGAVDFSMSASASSVNGATGIRSFAGPGQDLQIEGNSNAGFGAINIIEAGSYSSCNIIAGLENNMHPWSFGTINGGYVSDVGTPGSTGGGDPVAWYSINWGYGNNLYGGRGSAAFGAGLVGGSAFCTIVGAANVDLTSVNATQSWSPSNTTLNPAFIVGIGEVDSSSSATPTFMRKNGFVAWRDGTAEMPESSEALITARGNKALVTTEWVNDKLFAFRQEASAYTAVTTDKIIECTTGTFTVDLYTASGNAGRQITIKNSGAGVITVDADGSETIDGNLTVVLNQYDSLTIVSNGTNWIII